MRSLKPLLFSSEYQLRVKKLCKIVRVYGKRWNMMPPGRYFDDLRMEFVSDSVLTSRFPRLLGLPGL
jgi:hypothetical protein